jgi:hypothetical protein
MESENTNPINKLNFVNLAFNNLDIEEKKKVEPRKVVQKFK